LPSWHTLYLVFLFMRHSRYLCCNCTLLQNLNFSFIKNMWSWIVFIDYLCLLWVNGIFRSLVYIGWYGGQIFS
jgi:hypothetical protein